MIESRPIQFEILQICVVRFENHSSTLVQLRFGPNNHRSAEFGLRTVCIRFVGASLVRIQSANLKISSSVIRLRVNLSAFGGIRFREESITISGKHRLAFQ